MTAEQLPKAVISPWGFSSLATENRLRGRRDRSSYCLLFSVPLATRVYKVEVGYAPAVGREQLVATLQVVKMIKGRIIIYTVFCVVSSKVNCVVSIKVNCVVT